MTQGIEGQTLEYKDVGKTAQGTGIQIINYNDDVTQAEAIVSIVFMVGPLFLLCMFDVTVVLCSPFLHWS